MISPIRILKGIIIICIALFGSFALAAQSIAKSSPVNSSLALRNTPPDIQPLTIEDRLPDITFVGILIYKNKKAKQEK